MESELFVPIYDRKDERKDKKNDYRNALKDKDDDVQWLGGEPSYGRGGLERMPVFSLPPSMYGKNAMQPQSRPQYLQPGFGQGMKNAYNTSTISVQYSAPDGTMYSMSVTGPQQNRAKGLYNLLSGLYGLMTAEGEKGAKGAKGAYSGAKAYSGGKASN